MCGGTNILRIYQFREDGLSPRVRGNLSFTGPVPLETRSIPACAGEPLTVWCDPQGGEVYPRVCGGTRARPAILVVMEGLSPRVRGNLILAPAQLPSIGSIPACAGEPPP